MSFYYSERDRYSPSGKERAPREKNIYGRVRELFNFDGVSKMILGVGDCRTGTTAWLAAMARANFPAYYQIGKGGMRCMLKNMEEDTDKWVPDKVNFGEKGSIVVAKETIGPQNITECTFNPVKAYSYSDYDKKGLDPNQLHVVFFVRNPVSTLQSWHNVFGEGAKKSGVKPIDSEQLIYNYMLSAQTELQIYDQLNQQNIPHTVFAQELLQAPEGINQAYHSAQILKTISDRAGAPISDKQALFAVSDWQKQGAEYLKKKIYFPNEPNYNYEGGIYPTLASEGYGYLHRSVSQDSLTPLHLSGFQSAELIDSYNDLLDKSAQDLGINDYDHLYL